VKGALAIRGVVWPSDLDSYRDLAIARAILDGHVGADPYYAGAAGWYNPLIPAIVAGLSQVAHLTLSRADVLLGPILNALGPISFFLLVRRLIDPAAALFAGIAFLFMPASVPLWAFSTYTPWLFAYVAAQALLFTALIVWDRELKNPTRGGAFVVGILLGLTFLAHTAPALLLGAIVLVTSVLRARRQGASVRLSVTAAVIVYVTGALVSTPFWLPIFVKYQFHIINRTPTTFTFGGARPSELLASGNPALYAVMAVVVGYGLVAVWRARRESRMLLLSWVAIAAMMYAQGRRAETTGTFAVLPAYHLFFQLRAACWVLFGVGAESLVAVAVALVGVARPAAQLARVVAAGVLVVALMPAYRHRDAFTTARAAALAESYSPNRRLTGWIRRNSPDSAVFLASDGDGLTVIGPANRQVVVLDPFFSNPYLDYDTRAADRDAMFHALLSAQHGRFRELAGRYHVAYVLARGEQAAALLDLPDPPVVPVFAEWDAMIFRVRP
jgi:hypothetical protein